MTDNWPRIALVTGGNRGIGFEVCRQLSGGGFVVLLTARDEFKATSGAKKLEKISTVEALALDVADPRSIKRAADEVSKRCGHLDVLINNAGGFLCPRHARADSLAWRNVAVPLSQLTATDADESTVEAIGDWHYWLAQGSCF